MNNLGFLNSIHSVEKQLSFTSYQKVGAFAQNRNSKEINNTDLEDVPFLNLLQAESKSEIKMTVQRELQNDVESNEQVSSNKSEEEKSLEQALSPSESISSNTSAPDDFVMVELVGFKFLTHSYVSRCVLKKLHGINVLIMR